MKPRKFLTERRISRAGQLFESVLSPSHYDAAIVLPSSEYQCIPTGAKNWGKIGEGAIGSPPKSIRLANDHAAPLHKILSKSVCNLLRYAAKCQFTSYLLMVRNPRKWSRIHERIRIPSKSNRLMRCPRPTPPKTLIKNPLITFGDILFTILFTRPDSVHSDFGAL